MKISKFNELTNREKEDLLDDYGAFGFWSGILKKGAALFFILIILKMAIMPWYNVWEQGLEGKAELRRAEQNRKIAVNEAMALKDSAVHKAKAEEIRAGGIYEANKIISDGLGGPEGYLKYLFIDALQSTNCETIYIPTEAGLPILEARNKKHL